MSLSPVARQATQSQFIPSRRVVINDASQLPTDISSTPGGTVYSTTPGGTRIVYERAFLLQLRNSPIARTPPKNLPQIPGVTCKAESPRENGKPPAVPASPDRAKEPTDDQQEQFQLEF